MTTIDQETTAKSALIVDCGSTYTTAVLFDVAAGSFNLIARAKFLTTVPPTFSDITIGVRQAIAHISLVTGRELLDGQGKLIKPSNSVGRGVDRFAVTVSAAPPLDTLLVGLFQDVSLASARRVLASSCAFEVDCFSPIEGRDDQARVATLIDKQPDLVFIVGGTDDGAEKRLLDLVESTALGISVVANIRQQQILFAGNKALREAVRQEYGDGVVVHVAENVRPSLANEHLDQAIEVVEGLYKQLKIDDLPGVSELQKWSSYPLMSTVQAFSAIVEYFAALQKTTVVGVDIGSSKTVLVVADPARTNLTIGTDLGMGQPIANILSEVDPQAICRWIPVEVSEEEAKNFIRNKGLLPETIPTTEVELYLEQAVAREVIRCMVARAAQNWNWSAGALPPFSLLLARGGVLANTARPGQAILMLLDALQPTGIFSIALDKHSTLPALGSLASHDPLATVQALEGGVLVEMGWVVAPSGDGQPGQKVLNVVMQSAQVKRLEIEVQYGTLEVLPLATGESVEVMLQPEKRFDIGFGPGQGKQLTLHGGAVGLIIDARGRPLKHPEDNANREVIRQWLWDIGG